MAEKGAISWGIVKLLVSQNRKDKPDYKTLTVSLEKRGHGPKDSMYGLSVDGPDDDCKKNMLPT